VANKSGKEEVSSMNLYFSGIAGVAEYRMLESAGVERLLVDPFDLKHIPPGVHTSRSIRAHTMHLNTIAYLTSQNILLLRATIEFTASC